MDGKLNITGGKIDSSGLFCGMNLWDTDDNIIEGGNVKISGEDYGIYNKSNVNGRSQVYIKGADVEIISNTQALFDSEGVFFEGVKIIGGKNSENTKEIIQYMGEKYIKTIPDIKLGDMDGDGTVDPYDAYIINVMFEEGRIPTQKELEIGDIDGDGTVDPYDAYLINVAFERGENIE